MAKKTKRAKFDDTTHVLVHQESLCRRKWAIAVEFDDIATLSAVRRNWCTACHAAAKEMAWEMLAILDATNKVPLG